MATPMLTGAGVADGVTVGVEPGACVVAGLTEEAVVENGEEDSPSLSISGDDMRSEEDFPEDAERLAVSPLLESDIPGMASETRKRNRASSSKAAIPVRRSVARLPMKGRFAIVFLMKFETAA